nr:spermidine/spermine synthase [Tanacetum cinerariifolium]
MVRLAMGQRRGRQVAAVVDRILWVSAVGDAVCGDGCSVDSSGGCHGGCGGVVLGCRGVGGGQRQLGMVVMLWCVEWWLAGGCGVEAVALVDRGVVVAAVAVGLWMVGRRVGASDIVDRRLKLHKAMDRNENSKTDQATIPACCLKAHAYSPDAEMKQTVMQLLFHDGSLIIKVHQIKSIKECTSTTPCSQVNRAQNKNELRNDEIRARSEIQAGNKELGVNEELNEELDEEPNEEPNDEPYEELNEESNEEPNKERNKESVIGIQNVYDSTDRQENEELNKKPNKQENENVGVKTYVNVTVIVDCNKQLNTIRTEIDINGNDVVVYDEALVT